MIPALVALIIDIVESAIWIPLVHVPKAFILVIVGVLVVIFVEIPNILVVVLIVSTLISLIPYITIVVVTIVTFIHQWWYELRKLRVNIS